jgi:hypothetical protein
MIFISSSPWFVFFCATQREQLGMLGWSAAVARLFIAA